MVCSYHEMIPLAEGATGTKDARVETAVGLGVWVGPVPPADVDEE